MSTFGACLGLAYLNAYVHIHLINVVYHAPFKLNATDLVQNGYCFIF